MPVRRRRESEGRDREVVSQFSYNRCEPSHVGMVRDMTHMREDSKTKRYEDRSQQLTSDVVRDADADVGGDVHPYRALAGSVQSEPAVSDLDPIFQDGILSK